MFLELTATQQHYLVLGGYAVLGALFGHVLYELCKLKRTLRDVDGEVSANFRLLTDACNRNTAEIQNLRTDVGRHKKLVEELNQLWVDHTSEINRKYREAEDSIAQLGTKLACEADEYRSAVEDDWISLREELVSSSGQFHLELEAHQEAWEEDLEGLREEILVMLQSREAQGSKTYHIPSGTPQVARPVSSPLDEPVTDLIATIEDFLKIGTIDPTISTRVTDGVRREIAKVQSKIERIVEAMSRTK